MPVTLCAYTMTIRRRKVGIRDFDARNTTVPIMSVPVTSIFCTRHERKLRYRYIRLRVPNLCLLRIFTVLGFENSNCFNTCARRKQEHLKDLKVLGRWIPIFCCRQGGDEVRRSDRPPGGSCPSPGTAGVVSTVLRKWKYNSPPSPSC